MINSNLSLGYFLWEFWNDVQDPRTTGMLLVDTSPYTISLIMGSYLYFSLKLGPRLMKERKAFDLKRIMFVYNISMSISNAIFVYLTLTYGQIELDNFRYPNLEDRSPQIVFEMKIAWYYYLSKYMDLFDTIFFVLRKKHETHLSFLHLYHHTSVPIFGYLLMKVNALVPATKLFVLINGTIHTVMYSYYALSTLGPQVRKYLWWKSFITMAQMGQFIIYFIYNILLIIFQQGYPRFWLYFGMTQVCFFYKLFHDFYQMVYKFKKPSNKDHPKKEL